MAITIKGITMLGVDLMIVVMMVGMEAMQEHVIEAKQK
jgi:hypothetical protein